MSKTEVQSKTDKPRKRKKKCKSMKKIKEEKFSTTVSKKLVSNNWVAFTKLNKSQPFKINRSKTAEEAKKRKVVKKAGTSKVVALDCEMVSNLSGQDMLARVSLVDFKLECIYDKFVKPTEPVGDYRTRFSGIRSTNLENATDFDVVQKEVKALLQNKILVGHALTNDFKVLKFGHHRQLIRDTTSFYMFRGVSDGRTPSLKTLAKTFLECDIQGGEHDSIEDAKAAMQLYMKFRCEWEKSLVSAKSKPTVSDESLIN